MGELSVVGGLFALILGAFGYIRRVDEKKASKDELLRLCEDLDHITGRVDAIYDHLLADRAIKKGEDDERHMENN